MRRVLVLLIVANVLAFLWWRGGLDDFLGSPREPDRLARQVNADALRILPPAPGTASAPGAAAPASGAAGPSGAAAGASGPVGAGDGAAPPSQQACVELGPMEEARAARLREFIDGSGGVVTGRAEPIESQSVWMVYTPAAESPASGQRRVAELQRTGIMDIYLMPDGPYRNAISFGLFRTEDAAKAHSADLGRRGVRGVRIVQRNPSEARSMVELRHPADLDTSSPQIRSRLSALIGELGLNPVPCHGKS